MQAVRIHATGGPEVLQFEDVPIPHPAVDEIGLRVIAAGVNPMDWKLREHGGVPMPFTPGADVAGVVEEVGANVQAFRRGDAVFAIVDPPHGGYAEYTIVKAELAARKPAHLSFAQAAAIPTAALAAWQALFDTAGLVARQAVLIHGAAGGVGSFAVQLAKWRGAHVIGTASGEHLSFVRNLGAEQVIDYTLQRFENVVHNIDVVLDTIGGDTFARSWRVLKPGGFLVTLVEQVPEGAGMQHGVRTVHLLHSADGRELAEIGTLITKGFVKPMVTLELPLSEARQAQAMSQGHHVQGKIVLRVADEPATDAQRAA